MTPSLIRLNQLLDLFDVGTFCYPYYFMCFGSEQDCTKNHPGDGENCFDDCAYVTEKTPSDNNYLVDLIVLLGLLFVFHEIIDNSDSSNSSLTTGPSILLMILLIFITKKLMVR